jgi:RNA polymerase sigma-70 factor (ECF subfamily)
MNRQDALYQDAAATHGPALQRLARAHEANVERQKDLLQEIHLAVWRSLACFDGRCSLRTWVYRVAHNVAASHVVRDSATNARALASLADLESHPDAGNPAETAEQRERLGCLLALVQQLNPADRQLILLYLEGLDAASMSEITGLTSGNLATKIHRIKKLLARRFEQGEPEPGAHHGR